MARSSRLMASALQVRTARVVLASLTMLASSACSFAFVERAPTQPTTLRYFDCTSSRTAPVLDTIGASVYGVSTGVAVSVSESEFERHGVSKLASVALNLAMTALFSAGAIYGFHETARCSDANATSRVVPIRWTIGAHRRFDRAPSVGVG
jgi:hypothetical protein